MLATSADVGLHTFDVFQIFKNIEGTRPTSASICPYPQSQHLKLADIGFVAKILSNIRRLRMLSQLARLNIRPLTDSLFCGASAGLLLGFCGVSAGLLWGFFATSVGFCGASVGFCGLLRASAALLWDSTSLLRASVGFCKLLRSFCGPKSYQKS